jgi:hypothetical protein
MSNWINSGGNAPRQICDAYLDRNLAACNGSCRKILRRITRALLLAALVSSPANARDLDGRFAAQNPELHKWFEGLKSGKGPCCSDADGSAVSDVDWETHGGHYRVRIDGQWVDVPDEAVITEPNRIGRTMVWPMKGYLGVTIRCFMPGSMT